MKKIILFIMMTLLISGLLLGCGHEAEEDVKDKINFVPNEEYVGNPHPVVEEKMKLTDEEKREFEKIQKEILGEKEGE